MTRISGRTRAIGAGIAVLLRYGDSFTSFARKRDRLGILCSYFEGMGEMTTDLPNQVTINDGVLYQELGDEIVIMNTANESYYSLDAVGARFWQLLEERKDMPSIIGTMLAEFAVEQPVLERDLATLTEDMAAKKLVTLA